MIKIRFQEKYTGVQIVVYHCKSIDDARLQFSKIVCIPENWIYVDSEKTP
jgi:hypothetical protein